MSDPLPDLSIETWSVADARAACFEPLRAENSWERPGPAFVNRRIHGLIRGHLKRGDARVWGREADLYQAVHQDVWERFELIWTAFRRPASRPLRRSLFEAYMQRTFRNSLAKQVKQEDRGGTPGSRGNVTEGDPAATFRSDPDAAIDAGRLLERVFRTLSRQERQALRARADGCSTGEIARALGVDPKTVAGLRYRASQRFRGELIRILGSDALQVVGSQPLSHAVVQHRCRTGHPCFLYKLRCATARSAAEIAARAGAPGSEGEVERALRSLAAALAEGLAEQGAPVELDSCGWDRPRRKDRS